MERGTAFLFGDEELGEWHCIRGIGRSGVVDAEAVPECDSAPGKPFGKPLRGKAKSSEGYLRASAAAAEGRRAASKGEGSAAGAVSFSDALALAETRAPSQPAPPLPLTEQERLLMQVARRHDPEQVAMLNPEMRSKQELQAKVEFQEFFEPARPAEEKRYTASTDKKGDAQ